MKKSLENDIALLITVNDDMNASMITEMLKDNGIPCLKKYREAGGYTKFLFGSTCFGIDLYVPSELLEKADEVIAVLR